MKLNLSHFEPADLGRLVARLESRKLLLDNARDLALCLLHWQLRLAINEQEEFAFLAFWIRGQQSNFSAKTAKISKILFCQKNIKIKNDPAPSPGSLPGG